MCAPAESEWVRHTPQAFRQELGLAQGHSGLSVSLSLEIEYSSRDVPADAIGKPAPRRGADYAMTPA